MAKRLRAAKAYRRLKRPYTRTSKRKKKSFIRGAPGIRVIMYDSGEKKRKFPFAVDLVATRGVQLRDNALEAARQTVVRYLTTNVSKTGFLVKIRAVPHHVLRENPLATGAGADRLSQGMKAAFGKAIGHAAQVNKGKVIISIYLEEKHLQFGKIAAKKASSKLPLKCLIEARKNQ